MLWRRFAPEDAWSRSRRLRAYQLDELPNVRAQRFGSAVMSSLASCSLRIWPAMDGTNGGSPKVPADAATALPLGKRSKFIVPPRAKQLCKKRIVNHLRSAAGGASRAGMGCIRTARGQHTHKRWPLRCRRLKSVVSAHAAMRSSGSLSSM
eukprot:3333459-Prymnesium_polylepis.2